MHGLLAYGDMWVMQIECNEQSVRQAIPFRVKTMRDDWGAVGGGGNGDGGGDPDDSVIVHSVRRDVQANFKFFIA